MHSRWTPGTCARADHDNRYDLDGYRTNEPDRRRRRVHDGTGPEGTDVVRDGVPSHVMAPLLRVVSARR